MTADELRALAARVEQATEPDRDLDAAVALATGWHSKLVDGLRFWRKGDYSWTAGMQDFPPDYTDSLDAALTLVPAELWWRVSVVAGRPSANVRTGSIISPCTKEWEGHAATPALALTAAALRARAEEAGDD